MNYLSRIVPVLSLPLAFVMLVTGISFTSQKKQIELESAVEESINSEFTPVFRFIIASDIHINTGDLPGAQRLAEMFRSAYRYSDSHKSYNELDAVLFAGDNVDTGSDEEYDILNGIVDENLRDGTQLVAIMGNHEFNKTGHEGFVRHMKQPLDKHVVIKGFHIIGISPDPSDIWQTPKQLFWLDRELSKAVKDDPEKPVFTMQHGHIWNTVYVSRSWYAHPFLLLHAVYAKYPQVVNFSGHSHGPVNNPLEIWQNSYTQLGTGTLKYFEMERDIGDNTVPEGSGNAAQYLIVEVDAANRVKVMPYNILTDDFMKTPSNNDDPEKQLVYFIEKPSDPQTYAYTSARKKTATVPEFDNDTKINAELSDDGSVSVTFEQAKDDICVYGYRISVFDKSDSSKPVAVKEIYSGYYFEPMPETLSCTITGLNAGTKYSAEVTPLNVWLDEGKPLKIDF